MTRLLLAATFVLAACSQERQAARQMSAEDVAAELATVKVDPGQWQASTQIVSATGPLPEAALRQMVGQSSSLSHCITPQQAERPSANFLAAQQGSDCTYEDFKLENGRISGRMICTGGQLPGQTTTQMSGTYGPQSYDLVMDMRSPSLPGGAGISIKVRTQGRRTGECA